MIEKIDWFALIGFIWKIYHLVSSASSTCDHQKSWSFLFLFRFRWDDCWWLKRLKIDLSSFEGFSRRRHTFDNFRFNEILGNFGRIKKSACSRAAQNAALLRGSICKKNIGESLSTAKERPVQTRLACNAIMIKLYHCAFNAYPCS